jgi:hypothetical protein
MAALGSSPTATSSTEASSIVVERYKYILQQIRTTNENVARFLAIYQTTITALVAAALALFVNYPTWKIAPDLARTGLRGLLLLATAVAAFTILMIVVGALSWLEYRKEECELTQKYLPSSFRRPPQMRNFYRWYETYVLLFVICSTVALWILADAILFPRIA